MQGRVPLANTIHSWTKWRSEATQSSWLLLLPCLHRGRNGTFRACPCRASTRKGLSASDIAALRCSFKVVKVQTACSVATFKELLRRHLERRWGLLVLVIGVVRFDIDMSVFSGTKQSRSVKPVSRCPALQFFPGPYVVVAQPVFGHARGVRRSLQVGVSK